MVWVLFAEFEPVVTHYKHHIDGQIFTAVVVGLMTLFALYVAYRNFIIHQPTSDAL